MNKRQIYLIAIAVFTLLFMLFTIFGSWLLSIQARFSAITAFLFAFAAVSGQIGCLALYARNASRRKAQLFQQGNDHV